jgi:hypothetical protein
VQLGTDRGGVRDRNRHLGDETQEGAAAGVLGRVHRDVGPAQQVLRGVAGPAAGQPDAGPHQQVVAVRGHRLGERRDHPLGGRLGVGR